MYHGDLKFSKSFFDKRWTQDERCDVEGETWNYIKNVMVTYADKLVSFYKSIKNGEDKLIGGYKSLKKSTPTIAAYHGSGYDFHFLVKRFLSDKDLSNRY